MNTNPQSAKTGLFVELANYEGELYGMASKVGLGLLEKTSNTDYYVAYARVDTIARRINELQRAGVMEGLALEILDSMTKSAMSVFGHNWWYWTDMMAPEKAERETCTLIVCELDSGLGFHFCSHGLFSGSNSNLWFPLHDKAKLHQEVERVMVMNHQAINVTRLDPLRSTETSTDYTVTYNVNSARPRIENHCSELNLSVTPHGTWGAASADDTLLLLGLPDALQSLIRQVLESPIDFPDKPKKIERMFKSVQNGDHSLLRVQAAEIIKFQDNLAEGRSHYLNTLIERVQTEYCFYPDRATHIRVLEKALSNGDFSLAEIQADVIITSQNNLRSGANRLLKQLIDKANNETVEFPRRDAQLREMNAAMLGQDFGLAEALANGIIARSNKEKMEQAK